MMYFIQCVWEFVKNEWGGKKCSNVTIIPFTFNEYLLSSWIYGTHD